jgi:hypothetical protein
MSGACRREQHLPVETTMRVRYLSFLLAVCLCGCATVQDYHYCFTQHYRADAAWRSYYGTVLHGCSRDYQDGWKRGYFDVSMGQCEDPPPVPPKRYWNASYQSLEGQAAIADWYSGWQDGAAAAATEGNPFFHTIPAAPTAQPIGGGAGFFGGAPDPTMMLEPLPYTPPVEDPSSKVHVSPVPKSFRIGDEDFLDEDTLDEASYSLGSPTFLNASSTRASLSDEAVDEPYEEYDADGYFASEEQGD